MISNDRAGERPPYLAPAPLRDASRWQYLYATFRQALLDYLTQRTPGTVLMPEYVPQGVHDPYLRAGWRIVFYPVDLTLALDAAQVSALVAAHRPEHFVLIHTFGVYLEENVRRARQMLPAGTALLEDFAHTLPQEDLPVAGDLAAYSFTKMLGVPEGALLWIRNRDGFPPCRYSADDSRSLELRARLSRRAALESLFARRRLPRVAESALRRLLRGRTEYYDFLQTNYPSIRARIGRRSRDLLERVDFARVAARRREIAGLYVGGLDRRLLLPVPAEALTRQALYAFPVQVDDRAAFHLRLRARGVRGTMLVDHWWFKEGPSRNELIERHYLLPINHYLRDDTIRRVIDAVNACAAAGPRDGR